MLRLGPRLRRQYPVLVDQVLGTADPGEIEAALVGLPLDVRRCFHLEISVGALFGLELSDGTRVALKTYQQKHGRSELKAQQRLQTHLADAGFPCPRPVLGPTPFLEGVAAAEEWRADGRRFSLVTPKRRHAMAVALVQVVELGSQLLPLSALEAHQWRTELWPEPHNALFDFEATSEGAEDVDAIASQAFAQMIAGPLVVGHHDWSIKHFRFAAEGRITVVYDWDSVSVDHETVTLGAAAATHVAGIHVRPYRPTVADTLAFVDDYDRERGGLAPEVRRAALAYAVYSVAYTSRCEHALAVARGTSRATPARSALPDFADAFLA